MMIYCQLNSQEHIWSEFESKYNDLCSRKCIWKYCQKNVVHLFRFEYTNDLIICLMQCSRKTFLVHQTVVRWAIFIYSNEIYEISHWTLGSSHWKCPTCPTSFVNTHWGRVTHKCVSKLTIISSDNGLSPGRRQAIIWTNDGILLIGPLGTKLQWNFNYNSNIFIHKNAFEDVVWKMAAILSQPQCVNAIPWHIHVCKCWLRVNQGTSY